MLEMNSADLVEPVGGKKFADLKTNVPPQAQEPVDNSTSFKRNAFVVETGTGAIDRSTKGGGKESGADRVQMSEQLKSQYVRFLDNYLRNLIEVTRHHPNVLQNPSHRYDREILTRLTSNGQINTEAIDKFLGPDSPEGWEITTLLMEQQSSLIQFAIGLSTALLPPGVRDAAAQSGEYHLDIDRGTLNRFLKDRVIPWLQEPALMSGGRLNNPSGVGGRFGQWTKGMIASLTAAVSIGLGTGGAIIGSPIAAAVGLALPPAALGFAHIMRDGVRIDMRQNTELLQSIQANAEEAAYVRQMTGVDVNGFTSSGNRVELVPGRGSTKSPEALKQELMQVLYTRTDFYTNLGVPEERLDALPEQFLYRMLGNGTSQEIEQTGTRMQQRVLELFQAGGPPSADMAANLERFRNARTQAMMERMNQMITREKNHDNTERAMTTIDQKIADRGDGGKETERRTKKAKEDLQKLQAEKAKIPDEQKVFEDNGTAVVEKKAIEQERDGIRDRLNRRVPPINPPVEADLGADIDRIIVTLNATLYLPGGLNEVLQDRIAQKNESVETEFDARFLPRVAAVQALSEKAQSRIDLGAEAAAIRRTAEARAKVLHDAAISQLQQDFDKVEAELKAARGLQARNDAVEQQIQEQQRKIVDAAPRNLMELEAAFRAIITGAPGALNEADVRSMTADDLMARVSAVGSPYLPLPADMRQRLVLAKTFIGAQDAARLEPGDPAWSNALDVFILPKDATGRVLLGGVNIDDMGRLSTAELTFRLTQPPHNAAINLATGLPYTAAEYAALIPDAMRDVHRRLRQAYKVGLTERDTDLDQRIKAQEKIIATAGDLKEEIDMLTVTHELMKGQGDVLGKMDEMAGLIAKGMDTTTGSLYLVSPTDTTLTNSERSLWNGEQIPRLYIDLLNLMFDYQLRPDRDEYFQKLIKVLPPDKLFITLWQSLDQQLGTRLVPVGGPTAMYRAMGTIGHNWNAGIIGEYELRPAMKNVIELMKGEALAMS